jgi:maltooligosyltrehalose trehalohydrolase
VKVVIDGPAKHRAVVPLNAESDSYFSVGSAEAKAGDLYRYCLDGSGSWLPDPASPFQPEGPQGPSMIVEPREFAWHDHNWNGVKIERQVIYEMHIGTFTAGGTWLAARQQLRTLQSRRSSPGAASRKRGA